MLQCRLRPIMRAPLWRAARWRRGVWSRSAVSWLRPPRGGQRTKRGASGTARHGKASTQERRVAADERGTAQRPGAGALVVDETGRSIFARNPDKERPIASHLEAGGGAGGDGQGARARGAVDDHEVRRRDRARGREVAAARGADALEPGSAARGADGLGQPRDPGARSGGEADADAADVGDERQGARARPQEHALSRADGAVAEQRVDAARDDRDAEGGDRPPGAGPDHAAGRIRRAPRRQAADPLLQHRPAGAAGATSSCSAARPATTTTRATAWSSAPRSTSASTTWPSSATRGR